MLAGDEGREELIHYASKNGKRVGRTVIASEIHALMFGFDAASFLREWMKKFSDVHA